MKNILWHFKQILLAFDQLLNTILGGWADESFSARCYRHRYQNGWYAMMLVVNALFCNHEHCKQAYQSEKKRTQAPVEYREHS